MMVQGQPPTVDREMLEPLVQAATGYPSLQVETWQATNLSLQGQRTIFRFAGVGYDSVTSRPWSLILKVIRAPENADAPSTDMRHCFYWPRESLVYAAGIPQTLTGALRAPHCFGVMQPDSNTRWIWLEDLHDRDDGLWPLERYSLAAYHLGAFNGSYLVDRSMPKAPWLTNNGLRSRSADAVASLEKILEPTVLLRRAFPTPVLDELVRLVADRQRFLAAAAHLPQTFCHLDAWHGNMAAMTDANGAEVTVLFEQQVMQLLARR